MVWDGTKIKKRAKEAGISLTKLAESIGVSRQTIASWSRGQVPRGERLIELCRILKTSPSFFFTSDMPDLISVPQHRTIRKKKATDVIREESWNMAEMYLNLFRSSPSSSILPVVRATERDDRNAKKIAMHLREISGIKHDKPMDFEHAFLILEKLGIYSIFRAFPESISKQLYAFYSRICGQRVIFVNTNTNVIDLIFQLIHEAVHAVRDEEPDLFNDPVEEDFCDAVANYVQFPDEYIKQVAKSVKGRRKDVTVNILKDFAREYMHSLFGIQKRLNTLGLLKSLNLGGADTNLKREFPTVSEILFKEKDSRSYVEMLFEFSPLFMQLVAEQVPDCSTRKLGEWLGLDTSLDARAVMDELKRRTS